MVRSRGFTLNAVVSFVVEIGGTSVARTAASAHANIGSACASPNASIG